MTCMPQGLDALSRSRLRAQAVLLKEAGHDYVSIGIQLGVTAVAARDLCLRDRQQARRRSSRSGLVLLPQGVIDLFVNGSYAALVARTMSARMRYLAKIGSLYTKTELLRERGVGRATVTRVQNWLAAEGYRLRRSSESVAEAVCRDRRHNPRHLSQVSSQVFPQGSDRVSWRTEVGGAAAGSAQRGAARPAVEPWNRYERHESPPISDYESGPSLSESLH